MKAMPAVNFLLVTMFGLITSVARAADGVPPSREHVCDGLSGVAFGLCNAFCEAQDCDARPRRSCDSLRVNFARATGTAILPCETRCGDGVLQAGEDCDPPGLPCGNGRTCSAECTCPVPACGDLIVDPGEACDPPGDTCASGRTCTADCSCPVPACGDGILDPGEQCDPPGNATCPSGSPEGAFLACGADCSCPAVPACGNGLIDPNEECESDSTCGPGKACASCRCVGTGDVRITLMWGTTDDLDLHVIDPSGEEIFYSHRNAASGGELDVDTNPGCNSPTTNAVENVFWPVGGAPAGTYTVLVDFYENCSGALSVPFVVKTLVDGVEQTFPGTAVTPDFCNACGPGLCPSCDTITTLTR